MSITAYAVQDVDLDVSTAGSIAQSLRALREGCTDQAVMEVVTLMATKPMKVPLQDINCFTLVPVNLLAFSSIVSQGYSTFSSQTLLTVLALPLMHRPMMLPPLAFLARLPFACILTCQCILAVPLLAQWG